MQKSGRTSDLCDKEKIQLLTYECFVNIESLGVVFK